MSETVPIEKLVHGGQGIGTLPDGRTVFVWNALPGEVIIPRITKQKKNYAQAVAEKIISSASERIKPRDEAFLSTSPWQIMDFSYENKQKQLILTETLEREGVSYSPEIEWFSGNDPWHYRNKMEYSFYGDEDGLHLAFFQRGTHRKQIVTGSSIARPEIDTTAQAIVVELERAGVRASQLKTVIVRCSQAGNTVAALFVKDENFPEIHQLDGLCDGVAVYYSNPKSPASIISKELYAFGDSTLSDVIRGYETQYDVNSFFQVNIAQFEKVLDVITNVMKPATNKVDMYAGVGTMVHPLGMTKMVEVDEHNIVMAQKNVGGAADIVHASAESALEHIPRGGCLVLDPPRAGMHKKVVAAVLEQLPQQIVYLSCNPITQARDVAQLQDAYRITHLSGHNFFPRTPHIESLAVLEKKS